MSISCTRPSKKPRSLVITISRVRSLFFQVRQKERNSTKENLCAISDLHMDREHRLVWASLFQGQVYPRSYERDLSPAWGLAIRSWKALGERDTELKLETAHKERQEVCQHFCFHRQTQLLQKACLSTFWLFCCVGQPTVETVASPIPLGFLLWDASHWIRTKH